MVAGARFDAERMAAAASDDLIAATDIADLLVRARHAVPRGARHRRRAGARGGRGAAIAAARGGAPSTSDAEARALLAAVVVAGVQGLRGRDRGGARARAARGGAGGAGRCAGVSALRAFYARPVARGRAATCSGCVLRHGDSRRGDRRDRGLPRVRAGLPRLRRADGAHRGRCSARPGARTSTAPTGSTRSSTPSASPRAWARRC